MQCTTPQLLTKAGAEEAKATQCGAYVDEFLSGVEIGHQPVLSFWERRQGDLHFAANQAVCVFR